MIWRSRKGSDPHVRSNTSSANEVHDQKLHVLLAHLYTAMHGKQNHAQMRVAQMQDGHDIAQMRGGHDIGQPYSRTSKGSPRTKTEKKEYSSHMRRQQDIQALRTTHALQRDTLEVHLERSASKRQPLRNIQDFKRPSGDSVTESNTESEDSQYNVREYSKAKYAKKRKPPPFISSRRFAGSRPGYLFKTGSRGNTLTLQCLE